MYYYYYVYLYFLIYQNCLRAFINMLDIIYVSYYIISYVYIYNIIAHVQVPIFLYNLFYSMFVRAYELWDTAFRNVDCKTYTNSNTYGNPTALPSRGAVKMRTAFRNVWNHPRRMTLHVSANRSRIRMLHPYICNLSFMLWWFMMYVIIQLQIKTTYSWHARTQDWPRNLNLTIYR